MKDIKRKYVSEKSQVSLIEFLQDVNHMPVTMDGDSLDIRRSESSNVTYLAAFVSGRTYPPGSAMDPQGKRKAGGLSMYFPQLKAYRMGGHLLRRAAQKCTKVPCNIIPGLVIQLTGCWTSRHLQQYPKEYHNFINGLCYPSNLPLKW